MKNLLLWITVLLAATALAEEKPSSLAAATGTNALGSLKSAIEITSRSSVVDLRSNVVVYLGNVRVTEGTNMSMTSEFLVAMMPQRGGHIERIVAETNVVVNMTDEQGQKVHGTGQRLLYTYRVTATGTNEIVELSGDPVIETSQGSTRADVITYDRITGQVLLKNPRMHIEAEGSITNLLSPTGLQSGSTNKPERKP